MAVGDRAAPQIHVGQTADGVLCRLFSASHSRKQTYVHASLGKGDSVFTRLNPTRSCWSGHSIMSRGHPEQHEQYLRASLDRLLEQPHTSLPSLPPVQLSSLESTSRPVARSVFLLFVRLDTGPNCSDSRSRPPEVATTLNFFGVVLGLGGGCPYSLHQPYPGRDCQGDRWSVRMQIEISLITRRRSESADVRQVNFLQLL